MLHIYTLLGLRFNPSRAVQVKHIISGRETEYFSQKHVVYAKHIFGLSTFFTGENADDAKAGSFFRIFLGNLGGWDFRKN